MDNDHLYPRTYRRAVRRQLLGLLAFVLAYLAAMVVVVVVVQHWERMACIEAGKQVIGERCVEKEKADG